MSNDLRDEKGRTRNKYPESLVLKARGLYMLGTMRDKEICEKCGVPIQTLDFWKQKGKWVETKDKIYDESVKKQNKKVQKCFLDDEKALDLEIDRRAEYIKGRRSRQPEQDVRIMETLNKIKRLNKGESTENAKITITDLNNADKEEGKEEKKDE